MRFDREVVATICVKGKRRKQLQGVGSVTRGKVSLPIHSCMEREIEVKEMRGESENNVEGGILGHARGNGSY